MLVIPGVNAPGRVRARSAPLPPLEPAGVTRAPDSPALLGPSQRLPASPAIQPPVAPPGSTVVAPSSPDPAAGPKPRRTAPALAPTRTTNRLGRYLSSPFSTGRDVADGSAITVEPNTDPAAEAAIKRRIERQVHDALGDRAREVEVRVVGRDVTIRARGIKFWQRRSVRRTLESLPGLAGYRPTIEVLE
jgi:hypothetical protein